MTTTTQGAAMTTERQTRPLTGRPSWPIGLLTGPEKTGKTYAAVDAATSPLISETYWVGIGEDDPDEYGAIPGVADRVSIVEHDGSYRDIFAALTWAAARTPTNPAHPNLIVVDSATRLWELICDDLQREANHRAIEKASKYKRTPPADDVQITMDLWNLGKQRWQHVLDILRGHQGPSLLVARMDVVTVMDSEGRPTKDKETKIKAEKSLPFDVGWIVEIPELGKAILTGCKSLRLRAAGSNRLPMPSFTVHKLWTELGLGDGTGPRSHSRAGADTPDPNDLAATVLRDDITRDECRTVWQTANKHGLLDEIVNQDGTTLGALINGRVAAIRAAHVEEEEVPS